MGAGVGHTSKNFYRSYGKRGLDIVLASLALLVLAPLILLVAGLVALKLGRPVLFKQARVGRHERIFTLYKFRSMNTACDAEGHLLDDRQRLGKFGHFLRASSLDELPELWNIVKGEMSLVGPRPLLVKYLPLYNETQRQRHLLRPGLTGLAQVKGRNQQSWAQRFAYDVQYVEQVSLRMDWQILCRTVSLVLRREGIADHGSATREEFKGN